MKKKRYNIEFTKDELRVVHNLTVRRFDELKAHLRDNLEWKDEHSDLMGDCITICNITNKTSIIKYE